jgi:hypothetical protein
VTAFAVSLLLLIGRCRGGRCRGRCIALRDRADAAALFGQRSLQGQTQTTLLVGLDQLDANLLAFLASP